MSRNKVFLVTGASRGLGAAIVEQLTALGHRVLASARDEKALERRFRDSALVQWIADDLSDAESAQRLAQTARERFGRLDGLVNNAGVIAPIARLGEADPETWAASITINFVTPSLLIAECLKLFPEQGARVVNISSGAAVKTVQGWSAYCSAKAGLLHLSAVVAAEYPKVAVFSLRPGVVDTDMQGEIRDSKGMTEDDLSKFQNLKSAGRLEPPEVPGRAAAWLAVEGPLSLSGQMVEYTAPEVKAGVESLFGTSLK